MKIGNKIKKVRELKNYTQEYMADRLAMSTAGYSKIERDEVSLSLDRLEKISEILEVSMTKLMEFDDKAFFENVTFNGNYSGFVVNGPLTINEILFEEKLKSLEARIKMLEGK